MNTELPKTFTIGEAACYLGVSRASIYRIMKVRQIPSTVDPLNRRVKRVLVEHIVSIKEEADRVRNGMAGGGGGGGPALDEAREQAA